jgi:hypothetical protein
MIVDNDSIPMSEEEIKSIFDHLSLSTEEQRRALVFESPESGEETSVEIQLVTHTGQQTEAMPLLHA